MVGISQCHHKSEGAPRLRGVRIYRWSFVNGLNDAELKVLTGLYFECTLGSNTALLVTEIDFQTLHSKRPLRNL